MRVSFNQEETDPVQSLIQFQRKIPACRHLVLVSGNVESSWVQRRMEAASKAVINQIHAIKHGAKCGVIL